MIGVLVIGDWRVRAALRAGLHRGPGGARARGDGTRRAGDQAGARLLGHPDHRRRAARRAPARPRHAPRLRLLRARQARDAAARGLSIWFALCPVFDSLVAHSGEHAH